MPPLVASRVADLSNLLRRSAELIAALGGLQGTDRYPARPHRELDQVIRGFERINQTLEKAIAAGHLTPAQERSIAGQLERMGEAIEKAVGSPSH